MQSAPAYHDPHGHISPMATRGVGRNDLPRSSSGDSRSNGTQGVMELGFNNNITSAAGGHVSQFAVQAPIAARGVGVGVGPFTVHHNNNAMTSGTHLYTLNETGAPTCTDSYDFGSSNSGNGMSAIPIPGLVNSNTGSSFSSNKIRIPASAIRALSLPHSRTLATTTTTTTITTITTNSTTNNNSSSSSNITKHTANGSSGGNRDRGVIRTTISSVNNGSGSQGKGKRGSARKSILQQQQQQQQQQPKDRQSFHASLIELFARDKKALYCPKCHQEGNIHRDGISEGKMRFTCNTMVPVPPIGKRRKCNKHFYERAMHDMLIEIVRRKQYSIHGPLAIATAAVASIAGGGGDMLDVESSGGFHTDMSSSSSSSASPEMAPWNHPLLVVTATGGGTMV
ncbi:hypothetical protein BGX24_003412 [Mortierella sp. AD032]|nr:hypothetical protein BGX24_003412 [Mortierella sp. AD032]